MKQIRISVDANLNSLFSRSLFIVRSKAEHRKKAAMKRKRGKQTEREWKTKKKNCQVKTVTNVCIICACSTVVKWTTHRQFFNHMKNDSIAIVRCVICCGSVCALAIAFSRSLTFREKPIHSQKKKRITNFVRLCVHTRLNAKEKMLLALKKKIKRKRNKQRQIAFVFAISSFTSKFASRFCCAFFFSVVIVFSSLIHSNVCIFYTFSFRISHYIDNFPA